MNSYLLNKIINQIGESERMQKRIAEAELNLSVQNDIEMEANRKKKRELETHWILYGGEMP